MTSSPLRNDARRDLAGVAAVVVVLVGLRPDDVLDRETVVDQVAVRRDVDVLEVVAAASGRSYQRHVGRALDDVVAVQRADRDERDVVDVELRPTRPRTRA